MVSTLCSLIKPERGENVKSDDVCHVVGLLSFKKVGQLPFWRFRIIDLGNSHGEEVVSVFHVRSTEL